MDGDFARFIMEEHFVRDKNEFGSMNRRQLLKAGAAAGVCLALPGVNGCSALPVYRKVAASDNRILYLAHCNIIDVEAGVVHRDKTLLIRDGFIDAITDRVPVPEYQAALLDLNNQYVIPGLIDAHCHTALTGETQLKMSGLLTTYHQFKRNYVQQLAHGVTTVRDMGAMPKMLRSGLDMIASGEIIGPRVVYCNAFTNINKSHPDIDPADVSILSGPAMAFTGNPSLWFKDARELEEGMKRNLAAGASFIKLTMDNKSLMCGRGEIPVYTDEYLRIIMDFAASHNLPTAGHVHSKFGFDRALQYGIHSLEHTISDAYLTDWEALEMVRKKIAIVPTMIVAQLMAAEEAYSELPSLYKTDFIAGEMAVRRQYLHSKLDDDTEPSIHQDNMDSLKNFQRYGCENLYKKGKFSARPDIYFDILLKGPENLLKMKRAGVVIGCGTDSGVPFIYHGTLWREMEMLERVGFSRKEILQCATINNARILRMADKIGTIEKGKFADMAVLKENPLDRIEACRTPSLVIKAGQVYDVAKKA